MSKFEESNFYKALQDFFINGDKKTFLQFLAEFYNRTEGIIDKNNIQDELIKELRELYLEFNEKGIDENIVREKVNYFVENNVKIKDINSQLKTNKSNLKDLAINIKDYITNYNETIDYSDSFVAANKINGSVYVANGTFRISKDIAIDTLIIGKNGYITVDENVTFSVKHVQCDNSQMCFKGKGKINVRDNKYSVAWYEGDYINLKWDFLRKDFESGKPYTVVFPVPNVNDTAYISTTISPRAWKLNAPLIFDDTENVGTVIFESELYAVSQVDKMIHFSVSEKTEDLDFPNGIRLNGNNVAKYGLYFDGGARLKFYGTTRIIQCETNIYIPNNIASTDELEFQFLNITGYKKVGIHFDCKEICIGTKINYLFSNGCQSGGTNIVLISGIVRGFSCDKFMQVIGTPYLDVSDSNIKITPNQFGTCKNLVPYFKEIIIYNSKSPIIKALGNSSYTVSFVIDKVNSMSEGTRNYEELIILDKVEKSSISNVVFSDATKNYIDVRENCKNIHINNTSIKLIKKPVNCEDLYINGEKYAYVSLNNETVAKLYHPSNGLIKISSNAANLYGLLMCNTATIQNLVSSDLINVTTGILTGTTGASGKLNISFNGNYIYIENRVGNPRNLIIGVSDLNNQLQ